MSRLSGDDVAEDDIEKTDTVLAGLAYQYATDTSDPVVVLVSDTLAERAIGDALDSAGVGSDVSVVEGRELLTELTNREFDDTNLI